MNFESALKLLAEKRPETFRIDRAGGIEWNTTKGWHTSPIDFLTQDDLDEIAALLGWEYDVYRYSQNGYAVTYRQNGTIGEPQPDGDWLSNNLTDIFSTKLEAAKAALIAIIQEECK